MGYNEQTITVFKGFVERDERDGVVPYFVAAGYLKHAQYQHSSSLSYSSQTDTVIATALLTAAGINEFDAQGAGTTIGAVKTLVLRDGQSPFALLNELDQTLGYITTDTPGGAVRRLPYSSIPGVTGAFAFSEGTNITTISRRRSIRGVHNHVRVTGVNAVSAYVEVSPANSSFEFRSEVVQDNTLAGTVATRLLNEVNRQIDEIEMTVPGNPYLNPGMTVTVLAGSVGLGTATSYYVRRVTHNYDSTGYWCRIGLEGGPGTGGYVAGLKPHAEFTATVRKTIGSDSAAHYAITCDGSGSWDADNPPDTLSYAWSNNKTGTGTGKYYTLNLVAADLSPVPTITLTVTDGDAHTDAVTHAIDISNGGSGGSIGLDISTRALYVAASSRAEATANESTWHTWTPSDGGTVISTPPTAQSCGLFGMSNGKLYYSADYLATTPTLVTTFDAAVNCIWVNETYHDRVTVGLEDGTVFFCVDISLLDSAEWTLLNTYADAVHAVVENEDLSQVWVLAGLDLHVITAETGDTTQVSMDTTLHGLAMSYFGNFVSAEYEGAGGGTPDYSNTLGTGDRHLLITVTTDLTWGNFVTGRVPQDLVDGNTSNYGVYFGGSVAGKYLRFDFGTAQIITETTFHHNTSNHLHGIWQWQGSNDASSWTSIGATFNSNDSDICTSMSGNTGFYRYYQMMGVSGTADGSIFGPFYSEVEFKIVAAAPSVVIKSADDGTTKLSALYTVNAITHHIRNAVVWAADTAGNFYEMDAAEASEFSLVGSTGAGLAYSMQRDGDNQNTIYLASDNGLYVSFDMGRTWIRVRDYSGAGLDGLAVGYGPLSLI